MCPQKVLCWEPTDLGSPVLTAAQKLYENTIDADERIPWMWIERAVGERAFRRPTGWMKHLILASDAADIDDPAGLLGYAYGAFIPGFGGYLCYVGVSEKARQRGVGSRLFESVFKTFAADAAYAGEPLPFVLWESYRPTADEPAAIWDARVRLFDRVGGLWVDGLELVTPDYGDESPTAAVPLQLFVKPVDEPAAGFTSDRLTGIAKELMEKVYHEKPGDYFHDATFAGLPVPRLRPARQSARVAV
jgi:GNAT superfamily N-acetyltransferase